jgi:sodium/potassium/calcium exchanger 6
MRRRHSTWQTLQNSSHFGPTARRWTRTYHLGGIEEFPSVSEIGEDAEEMEEGLEELEEYKPENIWVKRFKQGMEYFEEYIWLPFETLTTLIRRLTIPLVDEETWDKNFAFLCPPFAILMIGLTIFHVSIMNVWLLIIVALGGSAGSAFVAFTSEPDLPPQGILLAPYLVLAFVMSVIWIMNIANEVLALLETLGNLFGISDSVLGVSVLAWGNSIGDLVSNTAIARDGFPTMAFAGCFAGPMFNLLVGIGASLTIATIKRGPVHVGKPSPLVFLGFGYLYMSLFINFSFAAKNGFSYSKKLCYGLLLLYASFTIASIFLVLQTDQKDEA